MGDIFIAEVLQPRFKTRPCLELCLHSQRGWFYRRPYTKRRHSLLHGQVARRAGRSATYTTGKLGGRTKVGRA